MNVNRIFHHLLGAVSKLQLASAAVAARVWVAVERFLSLYRGMA